MAIPAWAGEPVIVSPDRAWQERFRLFKVGAHAGLGYYGQRFIISVFFVENGTGDNLLGHDNPSANREWDGCPAVDPRDRRIAQGHIAFLRAMQNFVLSDHYRRRDFMKYWARYYHAGGGLTDPMAVDAKNATYAAVTTECWHRAGKWMMGHGLDQMATRELHPFQPEGKMSGSVWECP